MEANVVTLSLEKYEEMRSEIEYLRKQVQEKVIIIEKPNKVFSIGLLILIVGFMIWLFSTTKP